MVDRSLLRAYRCRAAEVEAAGGDNLRKNTWYSLTIGPVHISVLDTEADGDAFQEQIDRPEADPAEARADGGG